MYMSYTLHVTLQSTGLRHSGVVKALLLVSLMILDDSFTLWEVIRVALTMKMCYIVTLSRVYTWDQ